MSVPSEPTGTEDQGQDAGSVRDVRDSTRLPALVDAMLAIGADVLLPDILRRIVTSAVELVGARYGALGVLDEAGHSLSEFIHVGFDDETVAAIGHLPRGQGILGLLIVEPHPIRLDDLGTHPDSFGFPVGHPPMRSFLGVPIEVRGQVFGNLYLTEKRGAVGFGPEDEALAVVVARAAAVAIENARLHDRGRRQTLLADRERIAADLHDRVIQRIFATGLGLEALVRTAPPAIADRLETAVEDLDLTIREIHSAIFALQAIQVPGRGLRMELLKLATEASGALGFEPSVRFEGPVDTVAGDGLGEDLMATAREALANVARHAGAGRVEVSLRVAEGIVELTVVDDGTGPGEGHRRGGRGVGNLTRRAQAHGGGFELVGGASGRGSCSRWWAPVGPS